MRLRGWLAAGRHFGLGAVGTGSAIGVGSCARASEWLLLSTRYRFGLADEGLGQTAALVMDLGRPSRYSRSSTSTLAKLKRSGLGRDVNHLGSQHHRVVVDDDLSVFEAEDLIQVTRPLSSEVVTT